MKIFAKQPFFKLIEISDFSYGYNSETSKMGIKNNGLRVGITYYAYSRITSEFIKLILEFDEEIAALKFMNRAAKAKCLIIGYHAASARAEMWIIVGTIE